MSGRCRSHLYSRPMQAGARGRCVRCGAAEPVRGIVTDKHIVGDSGSRGALPASMAIELGVTAPKPRQA